MTDRTIARDLLPLPREVASVRRYSPPGGLRGRGGRVAGVIAALVLAWLLAACGGSATPLGVSPTTPLPATPTALAVAPPAPVATTIPATPPVAVATAPAAVAPTFPAALATPTGAPTPGSTPAPSVAPTAAPRAGRPTRLRIPALGVDAAIEDVGLTSDGAMDVPKDYDNTAWYAPGTRPGDVGNAAIAGHVDSKTGPAVFWELPTLKPGDAIFVVGDDGAERRFVVTGRESYQRADAPLDRIFGPTTARQLNLITCDPSSTFDRSRGGYASNVVIYAALAP
jgi:hypothetical protein